MYQSKALRGICDSRPLALTKSGFKWFQGKANKLYTVTMRVDIKVMLLLIVAKGASPRPLVLSYNKLVVTTGDDRGISWQLRLAVYGSTEASSRQLLRFQA